MKMTRTDKINNIIEIVTMGHQSVLKYDFKEEMIINPIKCWALAWDLVLTDDEYNMIRDEILNNLN